MLGCSGASNEAPKSTQNKAGEPDLGVFFLVILTPLSSGAANTSTITPLPRQEPGDCIAFAFQEEVAVYTGVDVVIELSPFHVIR